MSCDVLACVTDFNLQCPSNILMTMMMMTMMITIIIITPRSRVLPVMLTDPQPVGKFSAFYGTRSFINSLTRACYLSVSLARSINKYVLCWTKKVQYISENPFQYCPSIYSQVFKLVSLLRIPPPNPCDQLSSYP